MYVHDIAMNCKSVVQGNLNIISGNLANCLFTHEGYLFLAIHLHRIDLRSQGFIDVN
jgi:hypothetical protein